MGLMRELGREAEVKLFFVRSKEEWKVRATSRSFVLFVLVVSYEPQREREN